MDSSFRFTVGEYECIVVSDGVRQYRHPADIFYAGAPRDELKAELDLEGIDIDTWESTMLPYLTMVVYTGDHIVLVDTGAGDFAETTGLLIDNLRSERISPEDIEYVFITHCHPDHIGGCLADDGKPTFPNAKYVMSETEWTFWTTDAAEKAFDEHHRELLLPMVRKVLPGLKDVVELVSDGDVIAGMKVVSFPGHTPGNMALSIESDGSELICASDAWVTPVHMRRPEWHLSVATDGIKAVDSRKKLLEQAARDGAFVFATHMPFPGVGYVNRSGAGWAWQPING
jgi:glyoxylase-like metal-dependent hydrolase (beta-lactamase superfamily II)